MKACAFFDIDGTILNTKSMFSFLHFYWSHKAMHGKEVGEQKYQDYLAQVKKQYSQNIKRENINLGFYKNFSQSCVTLVDKISAEWWNTLMKQKDLFNPSSVELIKYYQNNHIEVTLVSGSMSPCTQHVKNHLNISDSLNTNLAEEEGKYTGEVIGDIMIGQGKSTSIKNYAEKHNIDLSKCIAYGDHFSDIPMMKTTPDRVAINPEEKLKEYALKHNWKIIED
jgi:HAD superfamily hydrolase (TIGR01490 family)